ncbi:active regulator of SIRT1 [Bufo gargarizans]|uniref:active regulator of SIRT1 n=1 Tax=Bufo gargarizans TaxID=30331 RepID=UPI001CF55520|nr:active regulator of SIRT1 [Bufo gargarizans]
MSAALLRKGLELLGSDSGGIKKRPGGNNQQAALSSHKIGMKKQRRRLKQQGKPQNQKASAKNRVIRSAVEEYKKQTAKDHLAQNLKYMLGTQAVANQVSCHKILTQHFGRKAKDQRVKKQKKVVEKSVFTDQDFEKFQKEYFGAR